MSFGDVYGVGNKYYSHTPEDTGWVDGMSNSLQVSSNARLVSLHLGWEETNMNK